MARPANSTRIYLVGMGDKQRLVRANNRNEALNHVVASMTTVQIADQEQLVKALDAGIKVEDAKQGEQPELA